MQSADLRPVGGVIRRIAGVAVRVAELIVHTAGRPSSAENSAHRDELRGLSAEMGALAAELDARLDAVEASDAADNRAIDRLTRSVSELELERAHLTRRVDVLSEGFHRLDAILAEVLPQIGITATPALGRGGLEERLEAVGLGGTDQ